MQLLFQQRPFEDTFIERVCECADKTFGSATDRVELRWRLEMMPDAVVHVALCDDTLAGFKIAYASRRRRLYSWLGGVRPDYRRRGIARALMEAQHGWAKASGYVNVETGTIRNNLPMLTLNLHSGFEIIGSYSRVGVTRVLMSKRI